MKVLLVDDEPLARDRLRRLLNEQPGVECVGEASNGLEALNQAQANERDAILEAVHRIYHLHNPE